MRSFSLKAWESEYIKDYYMYIPLTIVISSCVGGVTAMVILTNGLTLLSGIQLTICVAAAIGYTAAVLADINRKFSFWYLLIGTLVNIIMLVISLF